MWQVKEVGSPGYKFPYAPCPAWEFPYATDVSIKRKRKKEKRVQEGKKKKWRKEHKKENVCNLGMEKDFKESISNVEAMEEKA